MSKQSTQAPKFERKKKSQSQDSKPEQGQKKNGLVNIIIGGIVLAVVGVAVYFAVFSDKDEEEKTTNNNSEEASLFAEYAWKVENPTILKSNTINENVYRGKGGWYYNVGGNIDGHRLYTQEELETYKENLEQRQEWLAERDIEYIFVIVPSKTTIYPENLPQDSVLPYMHNRLDQLKDYLEENSTVKVLDIRSGLLEEKKNAQVYYKTDTHWNWDGAYIGYVQIMEEVAKKVDGTRIASKDEFDITYTDSWVGGLIAMLSLDSPTEKDKPVYEYIGSDIVEEVYSNREYSETGSVTSDIMEFVNYSRPDAPKVVIFGDSYTGHSMIHIFKYSFSETSYSRMHRSFDPAYIEAKQPDIVIQESLERYNYRPVSEILNPASMGGKGSDDDIYVEEE